MLIEVLYSKYCKKYRIVIEEHNISIPEGCTTSKNMVHWFDKHFDTKNQAQAFIRDFLT